MIFAAELVPRALANGLFGEQRLLANAIGNFGKLALVSANRGQVFRLADNI